MKLIAVCLLAALTVGGAQTAGSQAMTDRLPTTDAEKICGRPASRTKLHNRRLVRHWAWGSKSESSSV